MRKIVLAVTLLSFVAIYASGCGCNTSPGAGEKIGQVVKLSKQGIICKTWEGQLIRGGMSDGSGVFGTVPFDFTIEDDGLAKKVNDYMQNQTEVVINYQMEMLWGVWRSESNGHFLKGITPAKK